MIKVEFTIMWRGGWWGVGDPIEVPNKVVKNNCSCGISDWFIREYGNKDGYTDMVGCTVNFIYPHDG